MVVVGGIEDVDFVILDGGCSEVGLLEELVTVGSCKMRSPSDNGASISDMICKATQFGIVYGRR